MTKRQELELRSHDLTDKLNELESAATPDQAAIDAAQTEHREVRSKLRTAIEEEAAEETTETETGRPPKHRERLGAAEPVDPRLTNYLLSAFAGADGRRRRGRVRGGVHGCQGRGMMPMDLWETRPARAPRGTRAATAGALDRDRA